MLFSFVISRLFAVLPLRGGVFIAIAMLAFGVDNAAAAQSVSAQQACPTLLDRSLPRLQDDAPQQLCQYSGKVLLVVNTASYCGFTRQYEGLEALYKRYKDRGLVVLGFPSNDFGRQEPGDAKQIADLCFNTYGVAFPMFAKIVVSGSKADPLFASLASATGSSPKWNFHKYLIGRDGKPLSAYSSLVEPTSERITRDIETALGR